MAALSGILFSQNYEIDNIRPIAHVDIGSCNDIWGYTDPDGHEFALVGHRFGTYIYDVSTNPHDPIEVGFIPGETSTWRDLKVHGHYCYVTNETGGGIDIISLEDPFNPYKVGSYTSSTPTAHNLFIADGYAYIVGSGGGAGGTNAWQGIIILELSDPENPTEPQVLSRISLLPDFGTVPPRPGVRPGIVYPFPVSSTESNQYLIAVQLTSKLVDAHPHGRPESLTARHLRLDV